MQNENAGRRNPWVRLLLVVLLLPAVWLATFAIAGAALSSTPVPAPEDNERICGRPLIVEQADGRTFLGASTRVLLAFDQEWVTRYGDEAESVARALLVDVSALFRGLHVHLLPVQVTSWFSPAALTSAKELHDVVRQKIQPEGADIVVAMTGRELSQSDGWGPIGGRYAVVGHHPAAPERDALVLAHEVAHLFGATHGCDLEGHEGVMASGGFDEPELLCPCTRRALEMNAMRFHTR